MDKPSTRSLFQVCIHSGVELEDLAASLLESLLGTSASSYHDLRTGRSRTSVYLDANKVRQGKVVGEIRSMLRGLRTEGLDLSGVRVSVRRVRREDWSESWKRHFKPFVVGRKLLIRPSWSRRRAARGQLELTLDPGLSFGTGHHATTHFCLEQIVSCAKEGGVGGSCLDIGTGSGILALAAARFGYTDVRGIDFDPVCIRTSLENARANGMEEKVVFERGDVKRLSMKPRVTYSLVCANLIDDLLIRECSRIAAQVKTGGTLVLAGILATQFEAVRLVYEGTGFKLIRSRHLKEWKSGSFRRL